MQQKNERCLIKLQQLLSFMSNAEQETFYQAYLSSKDNTSSVENKNRCFAPKILKTSFRIISKGNMKSFGKIMGNKSRNIRKSFSCIGRSFKKLGVKIDPKENMGQFVESQGISNQCMAGFIKELYEILGSRRRYLLLNEEDSNSTAILNNDGKIIGYPWLTKEVETITKGFLIFAECYQGLSDVISTTFSELLAKMSADPVCAIKEETIKTKPKSFNTINFSETEFEKIQYIANILLKKSGDYYNKIGKLFQNFINSTNLFRKCNLTQMSKSMQIKPDEKFLIALSNMNSIYNKTNTCDNNKNYAYFIQKEKDSLRGELTCLDTDSQCKEMSFFVKETFKESEHFAAYGCIEGHKFHFGYLANEKQGSGLQFLQLRLDNFTTCVKGKKMKCSEEMSKMSVIPRPLQEKDKKDYK
mmetsp:Transcript_54576/g.45959  ORF Transcript_54576/g.45959 Transcript_54576/m.45959 type:complete len:415 (+) Transcript_54576:182-1426(+)